MSERRQSIPIKDGSNTPWSLLVIFWLVTTGFILAGQWIADEVSGNLGLLVSLPAYLTGFCAYVGTTIRAGDDIDRLFPKFPSLKIYLGIGVHVAAVIIYNLT